MKHDVSPVLILFAHPSAGGSKLNRVLADAVKDLSGVTLHELYAAYPKMEIDVEREQKLVDAHRIIVFHHPLYWYSTPAILKEWQDRVLTSGWAYGREGTALHGKKLMNVLTAGGSERTYRGGSRGRYTIRELLAPFDMTARLCGMSYLAPFVVYRADELSSEEIGDRARDYRRVIEGLRDGRIDLEAADQLPCMNADLEAIFID